MNEKTHPFNRTEGVVGLRCWIEKVEQVFEICKCAEEDKVMFAASTFEGRALTWWNGNGNITSSRPITLHDAINMARELVEQAVQSRAARISESNKRKWEDHQKNTNNNNPNNRNRNNNNHYQQQNRRQKTARAYTAAPADGKGYVRNLPKCNRYSLHHSGRCPPKCQKCQRVGHYEKDCKVKLPDAGKDYLQNATCYGCGEKGHLKNKYPKGRNQQNEGARGRAYVMGAENPQQNPNVVTGAFLVNDHYASILFYSGAEKSFVSTEFTPFIDITPATLDTSYEVELADGKLKRTASIDIRVAFCSVFLLEKMRKRMEKEGGRLSQSEKELKKLLGTNNRRNESESEQKDDNDDDDDIYGLVKFREETKQRSTMAEINGRLCSTTPMRIRPATNKNAVDRPQYPKEGSNAAAWIIEANRYASWHEGWLLECLRKRNFRLLARHAMKSKFRLCLGKNGSNLRKAWLAARLKQWWEGIPFVTSDVVTVYVVIYLQLVTLLIGYDSST
ncbi:putative reverse transcriptase domain-containing protein [Tanacetum coccineum]